MKSTEKYLIYILLVAVLGLYILHFTSHHAHEENVEIAAQDSVLAEGNKEKTGKIYYVNTDSLWGKYEYVQEITERLESRKKQYEKQIERELRNFEDQVNEIRQKAATMSQVELEIKQREFVRKESELSQMSEDLEMKFITEEKEWNDKLRKKILKHVRESMDERPYDFVLGYASQSAILLANDSLDLTQEMLQGLNEEYRNQQEQEAKK